MEHDAGPSERIEKPRNAVCAAGGQRCGLPNNLLTYLIINLKINIYINIQYVRVYIYIYLYGQALRGPPPPSPPKVNGPDIGWGPPSPLVWGVGPSSPCGVVVGFWGLGFSLSL